MRLVVDASPLILLGSCRRLTLLDRLAETVSVPRSVLDELAAGGAIDDIASEIRESPWISVVEPSRISKALSDADLGDGETAVLARARAEKELAVIDDQAGRRFAQEHGIAHIGTLGVLLAAKEHGLIESVRGVLAELIRAGLFASDRLIEEVLRRAGE